MDNTEVKTIPYSGVAEDSVLSAMLQNNDAISKVATMGLKSDDFYIRANQEIFEAMISLFNVDAPSDIASVSAQLEKQGVFEEIGGLPRLVELISFVQTTANVAHHAEIVLDKSVRRKIIDAIGKISSNAYNSGDETPTLLDNAEQEIFAIAEGRNLGDFVRFPDVLEASVARLKALANGEEEDKGVLTGFSDLDKVLKGLYKGNLILIAARPAMGKTSLAMNIAHNVAYKQNIPVAVFSLEMNKEELSNRIWSNETYVEVSKIQEGNYSDDEWNQLQEGAKMMKGEPLFIDDSGGTTVTEMRAKCRRLKSKTGLGLVVIDHLQLMQGSRKTDNRQQEVADISRNLKIMAKDLDVPILLLSQLNRNPEGRSNNRPALADLRESGAIEQDADVVLMLYREGYYNPESENMNVAECIISKHRNGPTGMVKLGWRPEWTTFETLENNYAEE